MKTVTDLLNYYSQFPGDTLLEELPIINEPEHDKEAKTKEPDTEVVLNE